MTNTPTLDDETIIPPDSTLLVSQDPVISPIDPVALNPILVAENITFTTLAIMLVVARCSREQPVRHAKIAEFTGYSVNAVRQQIRRTPWWIASFQPRGRARHGTVLLNPAGRAKLEKIKARIKSPTNASASVG